MSGLGSFIQGAMQGYTFGMGIEDAKDRRKRRKKDEEWTDKARSRQEAEWKRKEEERSVLAALGKEAREEYAAAQSAASEPAQVEQPPQPAQQPQVVDHVPDTGAEPKPMGVIDVVTRQQQSPVQPVADQPVKRGPQPPGLIAPATPDSAPVPQSPPSEIQRRNPADLDAVLSADPAIVMMADRSGLSPQDFVARMNPVARQQNLERILQPKQFDHAADAAAYRDSQNVRDWNSSIPSQADLDQRYRGQAQEERYGLGTVSRRTMAPATEVAPPVPVAQASDGRPTMGAAPKLASGMSAETPPTVDTKPHTPAPVAATVSAADKAEVQQAHDQAVSLPPDEGGSPSVEVVTQAVSENRGVIGPNGAVKATKAQRDRASQSFLDYYAENTVPKIVEHYAMKGDLKKAEAFETWAKSREARGQLESWSKAVHAASIGDDDAFLDHLADTYNAYDDGYEVNRKGSGFVRDEQGNIVGGKVEFRNTKTGETFVKTYEDQADIIREGIYALSPEQVFEQLWSQLSQASEVAAEQRKFERDIALEQIKAGIRSPAGNAKLIASAKKALSEQLKIGQWENMTPEQQDAMAIEYVRRNQAAGASLNLPAAPAPYTGG